MKSRVKGKCAHLVVVEIVLFFFFLSLINILTSITFLVPFCHWKEDLYSATFWRRERSTTHGWKRNPAHSNDPNINLMIMIQFLIL